MSADRPPVASVDAVREELRRLGYLDSGLDRFVLGGAGRLAAAGLARAALRVGLVGGVLFGLAATLAAAGLDRRLLRGAEDLVVLALYLVVAAAVPMALSPSLAASWRPARGRRPPSPRARASRATSACSWR